MNKKHKVHHLWLIIAAYGVWFALFSGLEEMFNGKIWKIGTSLLLGLVIYLLVEFRKN